jgi:uncharacterized protein YciI
MKTIFFAFLFSCAFLLPTWAQNQNPNFDSNLAKKLNSDDYGMKSYVFVILKTGKNKPEMTKSVNDSLMMGHLSNIGRLVETGKLLVAGPFGKNELTYRGLFILNTDSIEEAKTITSTDPAIKAGIFDVELIPWYGSAALSEYLPFSDKIWKIKP